MKSLILVLILSLFAGGLMAAEAEQWGTLKGRFVVDGSPPKAAALEPGNDPVCHHAKPVNESVLIGKENGLRNAVVYLRTRRGETVAVHPELTDDEPKPVELSNKECRFSPHVTLVRTGQKLVVKNEDPTAHNTKFDLLKNPGLNQVIPAAGEFEQSFEQAESLPLPVSCNIHPFMKGYVLIRDDPYMAVTDKEGKFEIKHLPVGEHQFQFWHETGYLKNVAMQPEDSEPMEADRRGRLRLTIRADTEIDLGEIRVPAELLVP